MFLPALRNKQSVNQQGSGVIILLYLYRLAMPRTGESTGGWGGRGGREGEEWMEGEGGREQTSHSLKVLQNHPMNLEEG